MSTHSDSKGNGPAWPTLRDVLKGPKAAADSLRDLAQTIGLPDAYLDQFERMMGNPNALTLKTLANLITFSGKSLALVSELLDQAPADAPVEQAIRRDRHLSRRQREIMIELYSMFVRSNHSRKINPENLND